LVVAFDPLALVARCHVTTSKDHAAAHQRKAVGEGLDPLWRISYTHSARGPKTAAKAPFRRSSGNAITLGRAASIETHTPNVHGRRRGRFAGGIAKGREPGPLFAV